MALYKDSYCCRKCGRRFTWCYKGGEGSADGCTELSGIMVVANEIYEVTVACPNCGAMNDFNCKIQGDLPGLKKLPERRG